MQRFGFVSAVCLSLFFLLTGCAKQLTRDLERYSFPIAYMMDSKECPNKRPITVKLESVIDSSGLQDQFTAKTKFFIFLPFVIFNFGVTSYSCDLGRASIDQDIKTFVRSSFESEVKRSGCFQLTKDDNADYSCVLRINPCKSEGPYSSFFYFYFALYVAGGGYGHSAGPGHSAVSMSLTIRKNDGIASEKKIKAATKTQLIKEQHNDLSALQSNWVNGLVESLSFAFKDCIEQAVADINTMVEQEK